MRKSILLAAVLVTGCGPLVPVNNEMMAVLDSNCLRELNAAGLCETDITHAQQSAPTVAQHGFTRPAEIGSKGQFR